MSTYQSDPITSLPFLYISGMDISVASTTALAISAGQCRDSNNVLDICLSTENLQGYTYPAIQYNNYASGLVINSAVNGANGLDVGSLAASKNYAVYMIASSRGVVPVAGLLSLTSNSYPTLPAGYDSLRLLGTISTTSSTTFVNSSNPPQSAKQSLTYGLSPAVSVLSGGNATSFTAVALTSAVPTTTLKNVLVTFLVNFTPSSAASIIQLRPSGSAATVNLPTITALKAGVAQTQYITVFAGVASGQPSVDYLVSASGDAVSLSVVSYTALPSVVTPT